jgi:hypothetical protein
MAGIKSESVADFIPESALNAELERRAAPTSPPP